jgi:hypothetical protein
VGVPIATMAGVAAISTSPLKWVLDVKGPVGPVLQALAPLPIHDVEIEPFKLEDFVVRHYAEH